jgi:hypothetical protein
MPPEIGGWLIVLTTLAGIALLIAWILLPFAMFGLKGRIRELIDETRRTNTLLEQLRDKSQDR